MTKPPKPTAPFRAFRPDPDMDRAMLKLQAKDGISFSEQIRRALVPFLTAKGVYTPRKEKKR